MDPDQVSDEIPVRKAISVQCIRWIISGSSVLSEVRISHSCSWKTSDPQNIFRNKKRFWTWLAAWIPPYVSPNIITCFGLLINVTCCLNVLYFTPDLKSQAPTWSFTACAIGVFLYQTMDALDGKQSFKVQNTPVEEIFDHMCDTISTVLLALEIMAATQLATSPNLMYFFLLVTVIAFYCSHWVCHITHTLVFGKIDVTEAQWAMILVHAVTAFFGQSIWSTTLFSYAGLDLTLSQLVIICASGVLIRSIYENVQIAYGKLTPLEELGIMIPRRETIVDPLIPLTIVTLLCNMCFVSGLMTVSPAIFVLVVGLCFSKLTMTLVMANISKSVMEPLDSSMIIPGLLIINLIFPRVSSYTSLSCALVYCLMDAIRFFTYSSWDLKVAYGVDIFSIRHPVGHPFNRNGQEGFYINGLNNDQVSKQWKDFVAKKGDTVPEYFRSNLL